MNDLAVRFSHVSKHYRIGTYRETTLRAQVSNSLQQIIKPFHPNPQRKTTIKALDDISFELKKGEVLGVVGANGSGKSTLLQILARVTHPTTGRVGMSGRIGSLLGVGTGFTPDLTGRENIYLNGAILGLKQAEIARKFDEIVAFSEIGNFLDTPVKHYSSGMRMRLAFSVAAYLDTDILLIDEVLAVGDAAFQKKSMTRMQQIVKSEGRTIVLVSHDSNAIAELCTQCIYLEKGNLIAKGDPTAVLRAYLGTADNGDKNGDENRSENGKEISKIVESNELPRDQSSHPVHLIFLDAQTLQPLSSVVSGQDVLIELHYQVQNGANKLTNLDLALAFFNQSGQLVTFLHSRVNRQFDQIPTSGKLYCALPRFPLMEGEFKVAATLAVNGEDPKMIPHAATIAVKPADYYRSGYILSNGHQGVYIEQKWATEIAGAFQTSD